MTVDRTKVEHLVVDSGAFIRGADLRTIGENIYSIQEVIDEIKDKATLERLRFLPYELQLKSPPDEDIKAIVDFSHKTGDYASLSAVDIKIMALAHYLERVHNGGVEHLNKEPSRGIVSTDRPNNNISQLAGFYKPSETEEKQTEKEEEPPVDLAKEEEQESDNEDKNEDGNEEQEQSDDDSGWITPANIEKIKNAMLSLGLKDVDEPRPKVALITTDYAMQNCLLQLGLKIVSTDGGRLIRETRQFVLRCYACFKVTNNLDRKFCPACGNLRTLKRVSVSVNDKGEKVYHINPRKQINVRGLKYSLPAPRGGKHANNPILVEDQPIPQHKASKFALDQKRAAAAAVVADADYVIRSNPFAVNDVYSRASRHKNLPGKASSHVGARHNPNATRRSTGNRKKKSTNHV